MPEDYNKYIEPKSPMTVNVSIKIEQVVSVDDSKSEIDFVGYLAFFWKEDRLMYTRDSHQWNGQWIPLNMYWKERLWVPDVFIYRMKSMKRAAVLQPFMSEPPKH